MYCIAVEAEVALPDAKCVLPSGTCFWAHSRTGVCTCTDQELTPEQFAERTGREIPTDAELHVFKQKLLDAVRK